MNILIIAVLSSFEIQNVFCVRELKSVAYHHNRNAKLFLSPGKDVTLFYTLILSFFEFPKEFCKKPGQRWPLLLCQNLCSTACSKIFQALGMCAVRAPTASRAKPGWLQGGKFLLGKKKVNFYPSTLLRQDFIKLWREAASVGKEERLLQGCLKNRFSQILSFSKNFCQQFLLFHGHLFFMRTCSLSSLQLRHSATWSLLWV